MTTENQTPDPTVPAAEHTFFSMLKEGRQRFLAHAIEHSFSCGRRSAQDFIRHFPPTVIMKGLEQQPALRAAILVLTTGIKQKIALKKEWDDAAADLQIALDEGETDAHSIVTLFEPDDRVRYLDPQKIWSFLTEGEFWKAASAGKPQIDVARDHVSFMLERALEDKLVTHRDVVEGVSVEELANRLPKSELGRLIQCALKNADKHTSFTEADLLATTPARLLVQYVPLSHIWDSVVAPRIAARSGYTVEGQGAPPRLPPPPLVQPGASGVGVSAAGASTGMAASLAGQSATSTPLEGASKDGKGTHSVVGKPKDMGNANANANAKVKLKAPPGMEQPAPKADAGPPLAKAADGFFGDDSDDIEVIEDDVKAG